MSIGDPVEAHRDSVDKAEGRREAEDCAHENIADEVYCLDCGIGYEYPED